MRMSRRGVLVLAGGSALGSALAQAPPPAAAGPAARPDPLSAARDDNRQAAEKLTQFEIPMSTEPAFIFRA